MGPGSDRIRALFLGVTTFRALGRSPTPAGIGSVMKSAPPPAAGTRTLLGPVVAMNAGVLIVLLTGPNSGHPVAPLSYAGIALAVAGVALMVRATIVRRKSQSASSAGAGRRPHSPDTKAV